MCKSRSDPKGLLGLKKVTNVSAILPVLENRLPKSCNVYNMARIFPNFHKEMAFYTLNPGTSGISNSTWIVATIFREDYGMDINISAPEDQTGVSEFKKAVLSSKVIDWTKPFVFAAVDEGISQMVEDLIFQAMGKHAKPNRNILYFANPKCFTRLDDSSWASADDLTLEVKVVDPKVGTEYLHDNWKFSTKGSLTYIRKLAERNGAVGVVKNDKVVSGTTLNGSGFISMLSTLPEYRCKGYAQICMKYFIKILFDQNLVPCCTVEVANEASIGLQRKLGLSYSHDVFYISRPE